MTLYCRKVLGVVLLAALMATVSGCQLFGAVAHAIPETVHAEYAGLKGQKVAVMCWVDRGIRIDYASLQLDTATFIQTDLTSQQQDSSELKGVQWPWEPRSVVRFQREHPELEGRPINEYAYRLSGVTRLIYIEVDQFSTRGDETVQLKRGRMLGRVKVLEIADGKAKIVYEKQNVEVTYPPDRPAGVLDAPDSLIYAQTVKLFGTSIGQLFYSREVPRK